MIWYTTYFDFKFQKTKLVLLFFTLLGNVEVSWGQFTQGNIVVLQVGDGSTALSTASTPIFLKEFTTAGAPGISVTIPASGSNALTCTGNSTAEGFITLSPNRQSIIIPGYNRESGVAGIAGLATSTVPRAIGKVTADGNFTLAATTTSFSTGNMRGATGDGPDFWSTGSNTGVVLASSGAGTTVSSTSINNRAIAIFNGQLYFSTSSGTSRGIYAVGTGLPTTSATPSTSVINTGGAGGPCQFSFNAANTVVYLADETAGIQKWTNNGSSWTLAYALNSTNCRGLTVDYTNADATTGVGAIIYATTVSSTPSKIIKVMDGGIAGAGATDVASAPTNTAFRGIAFAPLLPSVNLSVSANTGTEAGMTAITVTATASAAVNGNQTVNVAVTGTGITSGDYTLSNTTITIPSGMNAGSVTFNVTDDALAEGPESATLTISTPLGGGIAPGSTLSQTIAIIDNDSPGITITESGTGTDVTEGGATDTYTAVLTTQPSADVTIMINGTQATTTPASLLFTTANWNIAQTVTITAVDDMLSEASPHTGTISHTVTSSDANYNGISVASIIANITDNDTPNLTINDVSLNEGNAGTKSFTFTVSLSAPAPTGGVTFDIATANNTAVAPGDYIAQSLTGQIIPAGSSTYVFDVLVNGDGTPELNETFFVNVTNVTNATLTDGQGLGTIQNEDIMHIRDIQGAAHISPLLATATSTLAVADVPGIVTAKRSNGFYMQDPFPDTDEKTSEGIFIFTNSAPTVTIGDAVTVTGTVSEFRSGDGNNLTTTEISGNPAVQTLSITTLSTGNPLPAPILIGSGGRPIPTAVIDNDAAGGNPENPATPFDPAEDGLDFYESLEGMRVQINNAVSVSPTNNFGEVWVLADNGTGATLRTSGGGIVINQNDFNPERIQLDDELFAPTSMPLVNVGDRFNGSIIGLMDYSSGNYELLPTTAPIVTAGSLTKEVTSINSALDKLTIATFNVENLSPGDNATKFNNLASRIVNNLKSPDIITVEEIQDNNGSTNDAVVDAGTTFQMLITAISTAGGPTYDYRQINPTDDQDGGEPGGNIRVGFLFNPSRISFVDIAGGTSTSNTTVSNVGGVPTLSASPGRIDPANAAFTDSRKPLAGQFLFNGETVYVIGNHFNSKRGDLGLFGKTQPPTLSSETQRNQQAAIVKGFVQSILAINSNANILVSGDLNDFEFSNPVTTLESSPLNTLLETLPANERYTYNFEGNAQALDHVLVSNHLLAKLNVFDVVHINSEFADQDSDHDPSLAQFTLCLGPTPSIAGTAQSICSTGSVTLGANTPSEGTGSWSVVSGPSTSISQFSDLASPIARFTPAAGAGVYVLRWTITKSPCTPSVSDVTITVNPVATVNAGPDQTINTSVPTITLAGSFGGSAASAVWSGGAGVFTPNANTLNAIYTPTAGELSSGTLTLTLTANDPTAVCNAVSDQVTITINSLPKATISGTVAICQNATAPNITFTGSGGTAPYTFTYTINGGSNLVVSTTGTNSGVTVSQPTTTSGIFDYTLVSISDASGSSQSQTGTATITVNALAATEIPTASLCAGKSFLLTPASGGIWQSSNPSIASVNSEGVVLGLAAGTVYFTFTQTATGCSTTTTNVTIKPTPTSALTASKVDVCPNTEVTLNPNCSIPNATVNWNPGAPTVTPAAATLPFTYRAICIVEGCAGNESSVEVRTHRILVDMKDLEAGPLPKAIIKSVKDNMAPTNLIEAPLFPRRWTFIANGCEASESAVFKLSGPVNFSTVDNATTYALFANDAGGFYSIDHPNYGNGGSFPNGNYTLTIDLRSSDGVGGPFPKNRVAIGSLLATRTLQFTVGTSAARLGAMVFPENDRLPEQWVHIGQNPVIHQIDLQLFGKQGEEVTLTLLNLQGQTIQQKRLKLTSDQQQESLNVSTLQSGMYLLKAINEDKIKTFKILKTE